MTAIISEMQVGDSMGVSPWLTITQADVTAFGHNTRDIEPLHTDAAWCAEHSPYKVPIAYGFQTISMLTWFMHEATAGLFAGHEGTTNFPLNYGFNRLRLITPVRVGALVRAQFTLLDKVEKRAGELLVTTEVVVEIQDSPRPALVAEWLHLWVTGAGREQVGRTLQNK